MIGMMIIIMFTAPLEALGRAPHAPERSLELRPAIIVIIIMIIRTTIIIIITITLLLLLLLLIIIAILYL